VALLSRLKLNDFRNLKSVELQFQPGFNLVYGPNGSGKTSLLEAIYVLSTGRSFRTTRLDPLIASDGTHFVIFAEVEDDASSHKLGLKRSANVAPLLRFNEQTQNSWSDVAVCLPLQLINSDSFSILEGGGKTRRRFLDWALFHVEHSYLMQWRAYRRVVSQRNILLKQKPANLNKLLDSWDVQLSELGEHIHQQRLGLLQKYLPELNKMTNKFLNGIDVEFDYKRGWAEDLSLMEALISSRSRDLRYGATLNGPHRGDFSLKVDRYLATDALSRGQTKMLIFALKFAMGEIVKTSSSPIYLIDDLASELDAANCARVTEHLYASKDQCMFTAITDDALQAVFDLTDSSGKFHVEHGKIAASPATA